MTPDDPPQRFPPWLAVPLTATLALLLPAALAAVTHRVFLFASLGPSAVTAAQQPTQPSARAYNILVGHLLGMGSGFLAVFALGLAGTPSVFDLHAVSVARAGAALMALALAAFLETCTHAQHPPAASTTLLIALGSFHPTTSDVGLLLGGIGSITVSAEIMRRVRLRSLHQDV